MIFWEKTLWEGESPFNGKIKVVESKGVRRLVADRYTQSRSLNDFGRTNHYWDRFRENLPPIKNNSKILILGLGGGTIAEIFANNFKSISIVGVEIDPIIVDLGRKYFYLNNDQIRTIIEDAEKYVEGDNDKYDVVCVDLFIREKASDLLNDTHFLKKVKSKLKRGGVVIINKICKNRQEDEEFVENQKKIFKVLNVARERGNVYEQNVIFYGKP